MKNSDYFLMGVATTVLPIQFHQLITGDDPFFWVILMLLTSVLYIPAIKEDYKNRYGKPEELDEYDDQWDDQWGSTFFRIKRYSDATGYVRYRPQRSLDGIKWYNLPGTNWNEQNEEDAQVKIAEYLKYKKDSWLSKTTHKEEIIKVNINKDLL